MQGSSHKSSYEHAVIKGGLRACQSCTGLYEREKKKTKHNHKLKQALEQQRALVI